MLSFTQKLFVIVVICLAYHVSRSSLQKPPPRKTSPLQEAALWPGPEKKGIHLKYSDYPADWADLWALMLLTGFYTIGKLCVNGAFILYEDPLFEVQRPDAVDIIAGVNKCKDISENTKSIQAVGSVGDLGGTSITFFEKAHFGSQAFPTQINVGSSFFARMESTRSAVIIGQTPWTIQLRNETRFCVSPEYDISEESPVCMVRDFGLLLGVGGDDDNDTSEIIMDRATQGCKGDIPEELVFRIQDCIPWGEAKKGEKLMETSSDVSGRGIDICGGEELTSSLFAFYKGAISRDFSSLVQIGTQKVGKNAWKLELLDWIIYIAQEAIADDLLPEDFLNKVRELYIFKLLNVLDDNDDEDPIPDREYTNLLRLTRDCASAMTGRPGNYWSQVFRNQWAGINTLSDFDGHIDPKFVRKPELDVISETIWTVGHMVGYLCHGFNMHYNHFWAMYFHAFWKLYLVPIVPEWKKPQLGLELVFGGVNYIVEYKKLAMFTTSVKQFVNDMEPLDRPPELSSAQSSEGRSDKVPAATSDPKSAAVPASSAKSNKTSAG